MPEELPQHTAAAPRDDLGGEQSAVREPNQGDDINGALLWSSMDLPGMDAADERE